MAQVRIFGSQKYAVRVQLDPSALATLGIGIDEVQKALADSNVNLPTGTLWGPNQAFSVQATGQLTTAAAYRPLIVAYRNGSPVRLEQLGRVIDGVQTDKVASWYKDERAVVLAIQKQPGTNTIEVVDSINRILPAFRAQLPAAVNLNTLYDRSVSIRGSVHEVQFTLLLAVALVVLVIFLFLRNISATVIPSLALPMSIVGTFMVMYVLGYTLDNLSLMALTLAVGFIVDDAIVMLENIVRHMEDGKGRMEAALEGAREIGFTIVSMTASLAAVFLPVLFMGGIVGRLLHEFAVVIGAAVIVSGVVSLTLTPLLCSRFLRPPREAHGRVYAASEQVFTGMLTTYDRTLQLALRHPRFTLGRLLRDAGGDRLPLRDHSQGLHPQRGHRAGLRVHRGLAGHLVRGHDGAPAQGGRHRRPASLRGLVLLGDRSERLERGHEHRPHLHAAASPAPSGRPRTRSCRTCGARRAVSRASTCIRRCCPPSGSAASSPRGSTSTRCRTPISRPSTTGPRSCSTG